MSVRLMAVNSFLVENDREICKCTLQGLAEYLCMGCALGIPLRRSAGEGVRPDFEHWPDAGGPHSGVSPCKALHVNAVLQEIRVQENLGFSECSPAACVSRARIRDSGRDAGPAHSNYVIESLDAKCALRLLKTANDSMLPELVEFGESAARDAETIRETFDELLGVAESLLAAERSSLAAAGDALEEFDARSEDLLAESSDRVQQARAALDAHAESPESTETQIQALRHALTNSEARNRFLLSDRLAGRRALAASFTLAARNLLSAGEAYRTHAEHRLAQLELVTRAGKAAQERIEAGVVS